MNQNIYISDHEVNYLYSAGKVLAVGSDGQLCYEYAGQGDSVFIPVDLSADLMGHVFIFDYNSHRVHILDKKGRFQQYILSAQQGLQRPYSIDVDKEGFVWVGEYFGPNRGRVKVAKYLQ